EVVVEVAGPVVRPREAAGFRVGRAVAVDEARLEEPLEGGPFRWRNVGPAVSGLGVPYVGVRGRDVEVAADDQVRGVAPLCQPAGEPLVPGQLAGEERRANHAAVRRVEADVPDATGDEAEHAGLIERVEVLLGERG